VVRPGRPRRADSRYAEQATRLSAWLRARRQDSGLSQQQLAATADVAVATVRNIETGAVVEPGYFTVIALTRALGATPSELPQ
jgi:transcriptional regulator with XRE-family HTH domain